MKIVHDNCLQLVNTTFDELCKSVRNSFKPSMYEVKKEVGTIVIKCITIPLKDK